MATRLLEPLVDGTGVRVRLADGRAIGLSEHGDVRGKPLLWFPGTPSSRLWPVPDLEAARAAAVRVVVIERPGFGVSDFQPNRRVLDWPRDVVEVADALGLDSFAIAGSSGGGPYVAACAYAIPDRVRVAAMLGVAAPLDMPGVRDGMSLRRRVLYSTLRLAPHAIPLLRMMGPSGIDSVMTGDAPDCDRRALERIREPYIASKREAFRAGFRGFAFELALASRPWGFPLQDIRAPVHVWHGELDVSTPIAMGRALAAAIPTSQPRFFPSFGHFLSYEVWPEILSTLMGP
jgi:pimeloyl-ACP methyl ester carboxylesterase